MRGGEIQMDVDATLDDFSTLADSWPPLEAHLKRRQDGARPGLDFRRPESLRELTRAQLSVCFGISGWDVPLDRLCPPVPNRLSYIRWLEGLLRLGSSTQQENKIDGTAAVRGLDIGTGASCIYPLLGAASYGWHFIASDVDACSADWARRNIAANPKLAKLIEVRLVQASSTLGPILMALASSNPPSSLDFVMTNPPFFDEDEEGADDGNPAGATRLMAQKGELTCTGGEVEFVSAMIDDSLQLRDKVRWYTSMLGRKSSLHTLLKKLKQVEVLNVRSTEFCQGKRKRWGLSWSFTKEGLISGRVPDEPAIKVLCKKRVRERTERRNQSCAFYFSHPQNVSLGGAKDNDTIVVVSAGRRTEAAVSVPSNLPQSVADLSQRVRLFLADYQPVDMGLTEICNGECVDAGDECEKVDASSTRVVPDGIFAEPALPSVQVRWAATVKAHYRNEERSHAFDFRVLVGPDGEGAHGVCLLLQDAPGQEDAISGKAAFVKMCEAMHGEVLRQNRRWRRIATAGTRC